MLKYIVCEDNEFYRNKNKQIINSIMFKNNIDYKIFEFSDYNSELIDCINDNSGKKIYILDIELGNYSGIDIARKIREKDWDSMIIFSTAHVELFPSVFTNQLMVFDFISKFNDYDNSLKKTIVKIMDVFYKNNTLNLKIKNNIYNLKYNEIIYILYDKYERKTIIKTFDCEYKVSKPLVYIQNLLDDKYIKINKSLIVNKNNIKSYSIKNKEITFVDNSILNNIKIVGKELIEYVLD